nr:MAG TPA: hypothetical protein [Caudoviricetes sp.]
MIQKTRIALTVSRIDVIILIGVIKPQPPRNCHFQGGRLLIVNSLFPNFLVLL